jgi:hypothetical protein
MTVKSRRTVMPESAESVASYVFGFVQPFKSSE